MKKVPLCLLFFAATTLFFSCFPPKNQVEENSSKPIILGFSQVGTESAWRVRNTQSIKKSAELAGIQLLYDDAQQKQANQLKAIRSFIIYQVDVIAFVPIVESGWDNVLREALQAEIPVIIVDRKIKTSNKNLYTAYIGEDALEEGKKAAHFLQQKYEESEKKHLNIVELAGTKNSSVARERALGFRQIIDQDPKFSVVYTDYGDFLRSRGKEIADQIIRKGEGLKVGKKDIDIIFSHNDAMTLGLLDALYENEFDPGSDVCIVSIDGEQKAVDALKEGKINCIVECNPNLGPAIMELVKKIVTGQEFERSTYVDETVFSENDDFNLIGKRYY